MRLAEFFGDPQVRKILIGLALFGLILIIPNPDGLTWDGQKTIALLVLIAYLWITEVFPLPVTALAAGALIVLLQIRPDPSFNAFSSYAEDTIFFILGSLILAEAITKSGADRAIASSLLRRIGGRRNTLLLGVILISSFFSMLISDHAVAAIMLTVVLTILRRTDLHADDGFRKALVLAVAMACNVAGLATPSGGARNAIALGYMNDLYGVKVTYLDWVVMAAPITLILLPLVFLLVKFSFGVRGGPVDLSKVKHVHVSRQHAAPITILLVTVALWVTVGTQLGLGVVAIMGAVAMFAFGVLDWEDARRGIPWGVPFIYGAALALGRTMQKTGAADWIASRFFGSVPLADELMVLTAILVFTVLTTNFMSDGAAVAVVAPFSLALMALIVPDAAGAQALADGVTKAGVITAVSSAFAFVLVIGTPPNILAYSSGYLTTRDFFKTGLPMSIMAAAVTLALAAAYWPFVLAR